MNNNSRQIIFLVLIIILQSLYADGQLTQFCIGSPGNELATKVRFLSFDSSTIIGGYSYNYVGGVVSNCQGILIKVTQNGAIAWQKTFGVPGQNNFIEDMIITDDSNIVVAGIIGRDVNPYSNNNAALLKFSSATGNLMWEKCFRDAATTSGGELFYGLTELKDGTGRLVAVGAHNMDPTGGDAMVCVFQSNGTLIYTEVLGVPNGDEFESVTTSAAGNSVYICGEYDGNYKDGRIISYTPGSISGTINWSQYFDFYLYGSLQDNYFTKIFLSGSKLIVGGLCIQGWTAGSGLGQFVMTLNASDGSGAQFYGIKNGGAMYGNTPTFAVVSSDHIFTVQSPSSAYYDPVAWLTGVSTDAEITEITSLSSGTANSPVKFTTSAVGLHSLMDFNLINNFLYLAGSTNISSGYGNNDIYYVASGTSLSSKNNSCDTLHDIISISYPPFTGTPPVYSDVNFTPVYSTIDTSTINYSIKVLCGDIITTPVCNTLSISDSLHICLGSTVTLSATVSGPDSILNIRWSPATGLSDTSILNPILTASTSGWYHVTVQSIFPANLVVNGDFSAGNTGFTSTYPYVTGTGSLVPAGVYTISTDPHLQHTGAASFGDHTTGTGNMMAINGASTPISVWCETVPVSPNTYYDFSAWFANWSSDTSTNLPIIQFMVNGVLFGPVFNFPHPDGLWTQFASTWYSGASTTATICIYDEQTATNGNDFAIDDIAFRQICIVKDSIHIKIKVPDTFYHVIDTSGCITQVGIPLIAPNGNSYIWSTGNTGQNISVGSTGTYWVDVALGCDSLLSDTFHVIINFLPYVTLQNDTIICSGDSIWLGSPEPTGINYLWSTGSHDSAISVSQEGIYVLTVSNKGCNATDSVKLSVIYKLPQINLGSDTTLCKGEELSLVANQGTVLWNTGDTGTTISITGSGSYWVTTSNRCGSVSDTINIDFQYCDIWFPNAFTPNNDGLNDIAKVGGSLSLYKNFSLSIYNRWGQRVFYTEDIYSGWDGIFNGVKQDLGTYFYMIFYSLNGNKHMMKGDLELIR